MLKSRLLPVSIFIILFFTLYAHADVLIYDDFNNGVLDPAWEVTFSNATGWSYAESGTELTVSDITIESSSLSVSCVFLSRDVYLSGDFQLEFSLGWDSLGTDTAMQSVSVNLRSIGGSVAWGGYHDAWVGFRGEIIWGIGGDYDGTGLGSMPYSGSAVIRIERAGGNLTVYWNGTAMISQLNSTIIDEIRIEFAKSTWPTGTFGNLSADYIQLTGEQEEVGEMYHVDGINGDDNNSGLSRADAFATIQKGIDEAQDGNTVVVWPAVYNESIYLLNKAITVQSADEPAEIVASGTAALSIFMSGGKTSTVGNFIIRDSDTGIYAAYGSSRLSNLTIVDNVIGIEADSEANPDITSCIFWNNIQALSGCTAQYSYIQDLMLGGTIVSYWKLDGDANDSAGPYDGTVYGAVTTTGKVNSALEFDGSNDYVSVGDVDTIVGSNPFTICAWLYPEAVGGVSREILSKTRGVNSNDIQIGLRINSEEKLQGGFSDGVVLGNYLVSNETIPAEQWSYVSFSWDGTTGQNSMKLYINGSLSGTSQSKCATIMDIDYPAFIGAYSNAGSPVNYFEGKIDEVTIHNKMLSEEEIGQLYERGLNGEEAFDEPELVFADAENGDYHLLSRRGRYKSSEDIWVLDGVDSPGIDGGDPNIFPENEPVPNGGRINMGAYGNTPYASMSEWLLRSDFNFDGICNMEDMAIFADDWMKRFGWKE